MKLKFKNGTIKNCTAPVETKVFKSGEAAGWVLMLNLIGAVTSGEVDELLTKENISSLTFIPEIEDEEGEEATVPAELTLSGYEKVSSSTIRYAEDTSKTKVEIQLTKGV